VLDDVGQRFLHDPVSEMALTADHLLVIGKGRLLADAGTDEFVASTGASTLEGAYLTATQNAVEYRTSAVNG
jgi:ABC-2 type transport system ATP-binding protein